MANYCFFDLETTGINIANDRIVEISVLKVFPNGNKESHTWRVNPTIPIPKATSDIHGITDEMVADAPAFASVANDFSEFCKSNDLKDFSNKETDLLNYILFPKESKEYYLSLNKHTWNDVVGLQEGFGLFIE